MCYVHVHVPIGSMYATYGNIYHQYTPNVSIYTIHGSYGMYYIHIYMCVCVTRYPVHIGYIAMLSILQSNDCLLGMSPCVLRSLVRRSVLWSALD